jgi:hypothetical protein
MAGRLIVPKKRTMFGCNTQPFQLAMKKLIWMTLDNYNCMSRLKASLCGGYSSISRHCILNLWSIKIHCALIQFCLVIFSLIYYCPWGMTT